MSERDLDVRQLRKPDKHPTIFATYAELAAGNSLVLVNNHDPKHLRDEFEAEHPGSYGWEYLASGPDVWRIRITKLFSTPLPRVLTNTAVEQDGTESDASGAVWKLQPRDRDLDSNIIVLPPGGRIESHSGPDLDVLIHVLAGGGSLATEGDQIDLRPGDLLWLPKRSQREFSAGSDGLRYLTVHQRRQALVLRTAERKVV
ncbi:MAG TPA: DUF2249 domain-containing protein [Mycobacterium sp.]